MRGLPPLTRAKLLLLALDLGLSEFTVKSSKGEVLLAIRQAAGAPTEAPSQRGKWIMHFGLDKGNAYAQVALDFPDYAD